jgi:hypothetical protein
MTARTNLKRCVIAFWCAALAAGCAKVVEAPQHEATAARVATDAVPNAVGDPTAAPATEAQLPPPPVPPAETPPPAVELPATVAEPPAEPPAIAPEAPAAAKAEPNAAPEPEPSFERVAPSVAESTPADALDLASLATRLRKTKAINLRTKLAVKSESDDLVERFRAYHAEHGTATLAELRRSYDALFRKLHALLESADPPLARDIDRSRAAIWAILADPIEFGAATPNASQRREPQA